MDRFVFADDRRRYARAHAALRQLLGEYLGVPPAAVNLTHDGVGKPCISDTELEFSLSHSGDLAVMAVGWRMPLGIDVEQSRRLPDAEGLRSVCFTERERRHLEQHGEEAELIRLWTRKEALLKATGQGLRTHPGSVDVLEVEPLAGWRVLDLTLAPGYAGAVAVRHEVRQVLTAGFSLPG